MFIFDGKPSMKRELEVFEAGRWPWGLLARRLEIEEAWQNAVSIAS